MAFELPPLDPAKPNVCLLVGSTYDEDADTIDSDGYVRRTLSESVNLVSLSTAEAMAGTTPVAGVLCLPHPHVDGALLDRIAPEGGKTCKVISNYGVGVDHIELQECADRGIAVAHTPNVLNAAVADMAFALLLATARHIVRGDAHTRSAAYTKYDHNVLLGTDVSGTTLGIVGMGRIGLEVARRAQGFGMRVLYNNRRRRQDAETELSAHGQPAPQYRAALHDLLRESDHVILVCPCTRETRGMIDAAALAVMKPSATLVNIARGPVVNTAALTSALQEGRLTGAGLDVTDPEPLPKDHPLNAMDNVVFTPHRGSACKGTRDQMAALCVRNLLKGISDQPLETPVG